MAVKLDLSKEYKEYYSAKSASAIVDFGAIPYLSIEGQSAPEDEAFKKAIEALYPLAYGIKNICKNQNKDFVVPKLEGLWWVKENREFIKASRSEWCWKLLIRMPFFVTFQMVDQARKEVFEKKGLVLLKKIKFEEIDEGKSVQIMHIGPYAAELETLEKIKGFMKQHSYVRNGLHHEIYLTHPFKTEPEKLKTILRQPVK